MKHAFLLLSALLLAAALWLLLGDTERERRALEETPPWSEQPAPSGPELRADGSPSALSPTAAPAAPGEGTPAGVGLTLHGRVVDGRRRPVAGAQVSLQLGTQAVAAARSDERGSYALAVAAPARIEGRRLLLFARTADGRSGADSTWVSARGGAEQWLPALVVELSSDVSLRVVREGAGVLGARVAVVRRAAGVPAPLAVVDGDAQGRVVLRGLPPGDIEIYASAPGHGRGVTKLRVPVAQDAGDVEVPLQGERRLQVLVVDATTDRAVPGAEVHVGDARTMPDPHGPGYLPPLPAARTDASGRVEVRGLGAEETLYVNVRARGYAFAPWWLSKSQVAAPGQEQVRVAIARSRTVRFPILDDAVPAPAEGSVLRVVMLGSAEGGDAAAQTARVERGEAVVGGLGPGTHLGVLVAPDDSQAPFQTPAKGDVGATITFRAARVVRVRVVETDGTPVVGLGLGLMAGARSTPVAPATTDAEGRASFRGVSAERATLHRRLADQPWGGPLLATLDLAAGIEEHEVVLQPRVACLLTLRVEGEGRLPASYTVLAAGQRVDATAIEEDPARGELRFDLRPPDAEEALRLEVHAKGYLPETREVVASGGSLQETFDLRPGGRLLVHVVPPADGEYDVHLERHDEDRAGWGPAVLPGRGAGPLRTSTAGAPDGSGRVVFEGLPPGRYRAVDRISRTTGDAVDLLADATAPVETALYLDAAVWIDGRVLGPRGSDLSMARVLLVGRDDPSSAWSGTRPDAEGRFRLRVLRGGTLELRVTHPTLSPAAVGGRVSVQAGAGPVELRLEAGAELQFAVVGFEDAHTPEGRPWRAPLQVHLVPEGGETKTPVAVQPVATRGVFRIGGFEPGTYTLWVTLGSDSAPYVRSGLVLGTTTVHLGTLAPPPGARVRVRVDGLGERPNAAVWATVSHELQPYYVRHGRLDRAGGEVVVSGLGEGRFRVVVRASGLSAGSPGARVLLERSLTLQGEGETTLDVRLP